MIIGILNIELFIPLSNSLKIKRRAIKSIKERLRSRFNVSVAEIAHTDKWQRSSLCVASVSNEKKHIESIFEKVIKNIYINHHVEVINTSITFL